MTSFRTDRAALALTLAVLAGCGGETPMPAPDGAVPPADGSTSDAGTDAGPSCTPVVCDGACGILDDGCGGSLDCGPCGCTDATFATDCAARPCELASGCSAGGICEYEPITCDFQRCEACADGTCDADAELRSCGAGCAAFFCDPRPEMVAGVARFGNACVPREEAPCGVCGLGRYACSGDATACDALEIAGIDPARAECDGSSPSATVLYLDPSYADGGSDGSRERPFVDLAAAQAAAAMRGSRAIVIGGSPTLTGPLVMSDGVSVYGGFDVAPSFAPNGVRRPVIHVPASAIDGALLRGVVAQSITTPTELAGVLVRTDAIPGTASGVGATNAGAYVRNAPGMRFVDVRFEVGDAQAGGAGAAAAAPTGTVPPSAAGAAGFVRSRGCWGAPHDTNTGATGAAPTCGTAISAARGGNGATVTGDNNYHYVVGETSPAGSSGGLASDGAYPGNGATGAPYTSAAGPGSTPEPMIAWSSDRPVAVGTGTTGSTGAYGRGGGGGGSGLTSRVYSGGEQCRVGGSGGAGGAGGCGGLGGLGGNPGGWSVGVVVVGDAPALVDVEIVAGAGGSGGSGGGGSDGLAGAPGGLGGPRPSALASFPAYDGGRGGDGGRGQRGGRGGEGAAGLGVGVLCAPGVAIDLADTTVSASTGTALTSSGCS